MPPPSSEHTPPKSGTKKKKTRSGNNAGNHASREPSSSKPAPTEPSSSSRPTNTLPPQNGGGPRSPPRPANTKVLALGAIAVFAFSTYGSYLYMTYRKATEESKTLNIPADVSDRYHKTATTYDNEVNMAEKLMRLGKRRQDLVQRAKGDVLEVSCGTGRNMEYYNLLGQRRAGGKDDKAAADDVQGCRSVTFVDQSGEMVEIARAKFEKLHPGFKLAAFRTQDAMEPIEGPPPPPPSSSSAAAAAPVAANPPSSGKEAQKPSDSPVPEKKFDTVIQTMGACSHRDPVSLLDHLATLTEPEHGRILLLEHGRSHYAWLNSILDNIAPAHADRHGCWWNRDIGDIVRKSGLEVVESRRGHLGTTWQFVLRPRKGQLGKNDDGGDEEEKTTRSDGDPDTQRRRSSWVNSSSWITWTPSK